MLGGGVNVETESQCNDKNQVITISFLFLIQVIIRSNNIRVVESDSIIDFFFWGGSKQQ